MARRLFVGLMLAGAGGAGPARVLHDRVREAIGADGPLRWYAPEDLHLTLVFAGACDPELEQRLAAALEQPARATGGSLELVVEATGTFPELGPARILWAGIGGRDAQRLAALQQRVARACSDLGLPRDERPWRPHVTLARVRSKGGRSGGPGAWEPPEAFGALDPRLSWQPSELALVESLPGGGERAYGVRARFPLGPPEP